MIQRPSDVCHLMGTHYIGHRYILMNYMMNENTDWCVRFLGTTHLSHFLNLLHWLPLKQRIIFKLLLFVYKILNNQAPKYLDTCLNLYTPTRSLRSSSDPLRLTYSDTRTLASDRTFTVSASKYWNDLPLTVRQSLSVSAFRKALKTHLFSSLYCKIFLTTCIYNCFLIWL